MTEMLRKCFVSKSASETFYYDKWQRLAKRPEGTLSSILCVLQDMLVVVRNDVDVSEHEGICRLREKLPEYEDCFIACREKTSLDDVIEEVREFQYILESRKRQLNNGARDNARDNQRRTRTNRSGQSSSVSTPTPAPTSSAATVAATLVDVTTQGSDTRGPERRTCHRCKQVGHIVSNCPMRQ
ncbi:hypothetical protein MIR68_000690 [Amoeboaphelidium protococcarum]|nr:hypothetical protein MIR68_000690 [Amoeboaphelidium protococcarum]